MSGHGQDADDLFEAAIELGDLLAGQFGPYGRKILVRSNGSVTITGDVHRLFDAIELTHPVAQLIATGAVQQKEIVGDGSLAVVLLAAGLAERANDLLEAGFQRATVQHGFDRGRRAALEALPRYRNHVDGFDDPAIRGVARASLATEYLDADPLVDAIIEAATIVDESRRGRNRGVDLSDVEFQVWPTDDPLGVELVRGTVLAREPVSEEMARELDAPRVAVIGGGKKAGTGIEERSLRAEGGSKGKGRTEVTVQAESTATLDALAEHEAESVATQVRALVDADVDAVFTTMGVSDEAIARLTDAGIVAFRALQAGQARRVARATGASVVMEVEELTPDAVGTAGRLRVQTEGGETTVRLEACGETSVCTLVLSGAVEESIAEIERDLRTAIVTTLDAVDAGATVPGGGGIERLMARSVRDTARGHPGREAMAMESYADALEDVPRILARNAGLNPVDVLPDLRAAPDDWGLDCGIGSVRRVVPDGPQTTERVVTSAVETATDLAIQLVRIDAVLPGAPPDDENTDFTLQPDPERDVV